MTISILGCGWLGFPLATFLLSKNYAVKGSTTTATKLESMNACGIQSYLIDFQADSNFEIDAARKEFFKADVLVINIPPNVRVENDVDNFLKKIMNVTQNAIQQETQKIIFVSSTSVYANNDQIVTEFDMPRPETFSGKALFEAENYLKSLRNLKVTIVRPSGLIGESRTGANFFLSQNTVFGGKNPVNVIHQKDVIEIIYQIILQNKWNESFNLATDTHPSKEDFYSNQCKKENKNIPNFDNSTPTTYKIISNQKLKLVLEYSLQFPNPLDF